MRRSSTYRVKSKGLSEEVDRANHVIHACLQSSGTWGSGLGAGKRIGASSKSEKGGGSLHGAFDILI